MMFFLVAFAVFLIILDLIVIVNVAGLIGRVLEKKGDQLLEHVFDEEVEDWDYS